MKPKIDVQKILQVKKKNTKNILSFDKALVDLGIRISLETAVK